MADQSLVGLPRFIVVDDRDDLQMKYNTRQKNVFIMLTAQT